MGPELALAIEACVSESTSLLVGIFKNANQVRHHKKKCLVLGLEAQKLRDLLEANKADISALSTVKQFTELFRDINSFVALSKTWTVVGAALDVWFVHDFRKLLTRCESLKRAMVMEAAIVMVSQGSAIRLEQRTHTEILNSIDNRIEASLKNNSRTRYRLSNLTSSKVPDDLKIQDLHDVSIDTENETSSASIEDVGKVILRPLLQTASTCAYLQAYRDIQACAYVEKFYGVFEADGGPFAVLQDLSNAPTLARVCADGTLPSEAGDRLNLCCDVANSVAWFHRSEILVKSLSDVTVVMGSLDAGSATHPILTRLESSRLFLERTAGTVYDIRYEAPEYVRIKKHTPYTDVWSLAIILYQLYASKAPFDMTKEVVLQSAEAITIREKLAGGELPFAINGVDCPDLENLLRQCWNPEPLLRPTAADVALALLEISMASMKGQAEIASGSQPENGNSNGDFNVPEASSAVAVIGDELEPKLLGYVRAARVRYERARKDKEPAPTELERISFKDFSLFIGDSNTWDAVKYFLVGAAILWDLVDGGIEELKLACSADAPLTKSRSEKEERARLASKYLEAAVEGGYNEALRECYIAHSFIARELKEKADAWLPKIKIE